MQKFSDSLATVQNGVLVPLSTANVSVKVAGTETLATLYSDADGLSVMSNPLQSSDTGRVEFYAADGRYDLVITKVGYTTVTLSDILLEDFADGVDDELVGVTITNPIIVGGSASELTSLTFSATPDVLTARMMAWNATEETADLKLNGSGVTLQLGQEVLYRVRNLSGATIADGACVMAVGTVGNSGRILVAAAQVGTALQGQTILGLATEEIPDGADGFVTHFGKVRGINTTGAGSGEAWADGDILYAHPTLAGKLTKTHPTVPDHAVVAVAIVIHAHASGTLHVRPRVQSLESDVVVFTPAVGADTTVEAAIRDLQTRVAALEAAP